MSDEYNFCFPIKVLENHRLRLVPFDRTMHGRVIFEETNNIPELWQRMPSGPFENYEAMEHQMFDRIQNNNSMILFVILVREDRHGSAQAEDFAGQVGFLNSNPTDAATEIGFVTVIPRYQRSYVATNAVGLMLQYLLDRPSDGGLGLRRVQWQANSLNEPSIRLAKRMHFTYEGIIRWQRALSEHKGVEAGKGVDLQVLRDYERYGGQHQRAGRHSATLSMCWDDWLIDGKRESVLQMMERR